MTPDPFPNDSVPAPMRAVHESRMTRIAAMAQVFMDASHTLQSKRELAQQIAGMARDTASDIERLEARDA